MHKSSQVCPEGRGYSSVVGAAGIPLYPIGLGVRVCVFHVRQVRSNIRHSTFNIRQLPTTACVFLNVTEFLP